MTTKVFGHGGGGHGGGGHGGGGHGRGGWGGWGGGWGGYWPEYDEVEFIDEDEDAPRHVIIFGMFDLNQIAPQMNQLKQVPLSVAQTLLRNGQAAINQARSIGQSKNLPGATQRDEVFYKLQWHQDNLAKLGAMAPSEIYPSGEDLKKWVTQAFIESNAADTGAAWIDTAWQRMWTEINAAIAALPAKARAAVASAVENITGVPIWAWAVGGVAVVGLAGWFVYKLAGTGAGQAVASAYLGGRRR